MPSFSNIFSSLSSSSSSSSSSTSDRKSPKSKVDKPLPVPKQTKQQVLDRQYEEHRARIERAARARQPAPESCYIPHLASGDPIGNAGPTYESGNGVTHNNGETQQRKRSLSLFGTGGMTTWGRPDERTGRAGSGSSSSSGGSEGSGGSGQSLTSGELGAVSQGQGGAGDLTSLAEEECLI